MLTIYGFINNKLAFDTSKDTALQNDAEIFQQKASEENKPIVTRKNQFRSMFYCCWQNSKSLVKPKGSKCADFV